jgi:hypothetical protein
MGSLGAAQTVNQLTPHMNMLLMCLTDLHSAWHLALLLLVRPQQLLQP